MTQGSKTIRLSKIAREFNVGISTIVDFLRKKGEEIDSNPNTKVPPELYDILIQEYGSERNVKKESKKLSQRKLAEEMEAVSIADIDEDKEIKPGQVEDEVLITDMSSTVLQSESHTYSDQDTDILEKDTANEVDSADKEIIDKEVEGKEKPEEDKAKKKKDKIAADVIDKDEGKKENEETEAVAVGEKENDIDLKVVGKIDLSSINQKTRPEKKTRKKKTEKVEGEKVLETLKAKKEEKDKEELSEEEKLVFKSEIEKLTGPTVVGKIKLKEKEKAKKPVASTDKENLEKKKRKRIYKDRIDIEKDKKADTKDEKVTAGKKPVTAPKKESRKKKKPLRPEISEEDVQKQIKDTLARLTTKGKSKGAKYRREKRDAISAKQKEEDEKIEQEKNIIKVTEFVTVNELATMMDVPVNQVIESCMSLGLFVSINQRLDAETMGLVADEFNFGVEFVSVEVQEAITENIDDEKNLQPRPPIVTVMGHVDHGKTLLLDYIRNTNVIAGEAGGITQHIGAYNVSLDGDKKITFLDTPGHEAFTAMRARGAQITDIAIIVIAADDNVMPQTVEAINHAHAAGVPIVFAINKIDKAGANPEKIKEELANMKFLVEDWGGKYQSQEISAKNGTNIEELLEKVLLEAEMLELTANPEKKAIGAVIESSLDKGRGFVTTLLVDSGNLKVGDILLVGTFTGRVKAMYNERGKRINIAGPSTPVLILGLNGAPQAGDNFNVMDNDKEAREIANKREQLQREQGIRTQKHITLDELGRRIAIGNFQELNIIVKGDVDGSIEALSDSLIKLSTEEIEVNIIHKAVGQISESDIMLAMASNAIIIGFQVRPSMNARKLAEKEEIEIRLYSIIYDAINEIKDAMEGMLSPEVKEEIVSTIEVLEVFKITKVGTIAGCMVKEGKINRNTKIRLIREGIVAYSGELGSLKRFKDDVKEVANGFECGLNIKDFNDIKVGDIIEGYKMIEVKKTM